MDFTISQYKSLLKALQSQSYSFYTFAGFVIGAKPKSIVLRHDVDKLPKHSLRFAKIQAEMGIKGTYYFRIVPESWDEAIIKEIAALGHEIGYHYETMDTAFSKKKRMGHGAKGEKSNSKFYNDLIDLAYEEFCINLEKFRKVVEVKTISMHGSPLSSFDNRAIWGKYDYKKLGLVAEPYFDLDFNKTFYITDTGRRWDGDKFNVRDKATEENPLTYKGFLDLHFHSTQDLIETIEQGNFPTQAMFNFHPQRWNDAIIPWVKELLWQNVKNQVKRLIVRSS